MSDSSAYLKGVNLHELVQRYLQDEFAELIIPLNVEIEHLEKTQDAILSVESNQTMPFEFDFGTGRNFACVGYKVCGLDGKYIAYDPSNTYNCMYCLRQITWNPIGIPILRVEKNNKIYFFMIDIFCTFDCALAEFKRRNNNVLYVHTQAYFSELFALCTEQNPAKMRTASDQRYLEIFNGPMSWEQFHKNTTKYSSKPGVIYFMPVIEYLEQDSY